MMDVQTASLWKRISALLFDVILLAVAAVLCALLLSGVVGYDRHSDALQDCYTRIGGAYGVDLLASQSEYENADEERRTAYQDAFRALSENEEAVYEYNMVMQLTFLIISLSLLTAVMIMEFALPLILKNGQTLGKKIFGVALMRSDSVRITAVSLFIRTLLGKYAIETMIPAVIALMIYFNSIGILGAAILLLIVLLQAGLLLFTRRRTPIHDLLADTVAVDYSSQRIFDTREDMLAYIEKKHAEAVAAEAD